MPTFFVLRRKDGVYMPDIKGRAGGTFVDPDNKKAQRSTPRLFARRQDAAATLAWWLKGHFEVSAPYSFGEDDGGPRREAFIPQPSRRIEDWSIIEVELKEVLDV